MDVILIPGFWLGSATWSEVTPSLEAAGHRVHPVTLPGKEAGTAALPEIDLRDHVDAVVALVDSLPQPVALVGHSGGGGIAHGVVDSRPRSIARVVYVDSGPLADGASINDGLPADGDVVPFPGWDAFGEEELRDMDDDVRARFEAVAVPEPKGVAYGALRLSDEARYDVPVTVICCTMPAATLRELMTAGHSFTAELARCRSVELVELPTGHWPQFTRPAELGSTIVTALGER